MTSGEQSCYIVCESVSCSIDMGRHVLALWSRFGRALACALCHVLIMHTHLLCTRGFLMKAHQNLESNAQHIVLRQPCEMTNLNEAMINIGSRMPFKRAPYRLVHQI